MGLLDSLAGSVLKGTTGTTTTGTKQNDIVGALMGMLGNQQSGGLGGLVQQFIGKGLGDIVNSWVSTGSNLPITQNQLQQGLGTDMISQLAAKVGLTPDQVTSHLTELLPTVVDKLTPNGQVEEGDLMSKGMDILKGFMK